ARRAGKPSEAPPEPETRSEGAGGDATLHVLDDSLAELGALDLANPALAFLLHQASEVISDGLGGDRAVHPPDDQVGRFAPAHITEHPLARPDHRSRIDLIEVRVLRRGAVSRLENRMTSHVVDVSARSDTDAPHLRCKGVGKVVAVQVQSRDDVELL